MQRCAHESSPCPPFCRCLLTTPPSHSLSASDLIGGGKDPCPNIHKWAAVVVDCPSGWGWWFILLLCLGAGGYVGGFALYNHKRKPRVYFKALESERQVDEEELLGSHLPHALVREKSRTTNHL